jgi:hypothetical protein
MEFEQKISIEEKEILSPLQLYVEVQKLKWEVARLLSNAESERGEAGTFQRALKRLKDDILKLEQDYRMSMFDTEAGIVVKLDRLIVESKDRKNFKNQIIGLWVSLICVIVAFVLKLLL